METVSRFSSLESSSGKSNGEMKMEIGISREFLLKMVHFTACLGDPGKGLLERDKLMGKQRKRPMLGSMPLTR